MTAPEPTAGDRCPEHPASPVDDPSEVARRRFLTEPVVRPTSSPAVAASTGTSEDVETLDPDRPYAHLTFAEVLDDYVLVRGDLSAEYARKQLVREHEAREAAARAEALHTVADEWLSEHDGEASHVARFLRERAARIARESNLDTRQDSGEGDDRA